MDRERTIEVINSVIDVYFDMIEILNREAIANDAYSMAKKYLVLDAQKYLKENLK